MRKILTIAEAAELTRIPLKTFKRFVSKRKDGLPVIVYTKKQVYIQNQNGELDAWIDQHSLKRALRWVAR